MSSKSPWKATRLELLKGGALRVADDLKVQERLISERDAAQAKVERLEHANAELRAERDALVEERDRLLQANENNLAAWEGERRSLLEARDAAQAEVERSETLQERIRDDALNEAEERHRNAEHANVELLDALEAQAEAFGQLWAGIGDRLCGGQSLSEGYAQSIESQARRAEDAARALIDKHRGSASRKRAPRPPEPPRAATVKRFRRNPPPIRGSTPG